MFMMKSELVDHVSDTMDDLFKVLTKTNLWKKAFHNFRTFVWISTNSTYCCVWDYHS
jgi:hypothetical protein